MENFLSKKYPDLPGSRPVNRAVEKVKRAGESIPYTRDERVNAFLDRFENLMKDERGFSLLKHKLLEKYTLKPEAIPESYWLLQDVIMNERGQGGDSDQKKLEMKQQIADGALSDQRVSLEQWIDYLAASDSKYIPREFKYWIFRNIIGLQEYDKEKKEFPKRSRGTMKQFPDINHEALAYVMDAIMKKYGGTRVHFEYDIQPDEQEAFNSFLEKEDFAKLYAWANDLVNPVPESLLQITDGEWRKFEKESDHQVLIQTIRGKGTGWCTAGENTARKQLDGGDFHIFYSLDNNKNPTIPRIAIRMENNDIVEVRGIAYKQNLDPYIGEVLARKLEEFHDGEQYVKKEHDMNLLTYIGQKVQQNGLLTRNELLFLYEVNSQIDGFGYRKDPRIQTLREQRDRGKDLSIIFDCAQGQIAYEENQINEDTKVYIGKWTPEAMSLLPRNIQHIYEKFPNRKPFMQIIDPELDIKTTADVFHAFKSRSGQEINVDSGTKKMLEKISFSGEQLQIVAFSVDGLGLSNGATLSEIYERAKSYGLSLCPAEVGPRLRFQYLGDSLFVGMSPIIIPEGGVGEFGEETSAVFIVGHNGVDLFLGNRGCDNADSNKFFVSDTFVFFRNK
ncbi:MAG: hypothetical protein WCG73_00910 [Candidatus Moraniibacteriota bacterium]